MNVTTWDGDLGPSKDMPANLDASVEKANELESSVAGPTLNPEQLPVLPVAVEEPVTSKDATPVAPTVVGQHQPLVQQPVEYPRPHDVLLPAEGYQLWPGNASFLTLVEKYQTEFAQARSRAEQSRLAAHILETIKFEGGRFLTAIEVPMTETSALSAQKSIVRTSAWDLMKDADVLLHLGESLSYSRQMDEAKRLARKEKKRRRRDRKRRRKERHRERRRQREQMAEKTNEASVLPSAMGALQSLYYVPSYFPGDNRKTGLECESESLSSSSSSSSENETHAVHAAKKKRIGVRKTSLPRPLAQTPTPGMVELAENPTTEQRPAENPNAPQTQVSFHYKPKPNKSLKAAVYNEGEISLPKGVTVRPSGKWQAQTYFAGQSRYVGVYDTSRLAARAYVVVQDILRQYRGSKSISKDSPKEDLALIFANARRAADDAVREMLQQDVTSNYKPISITVPESALQTVPCGVGVEADTASEEPNKSVNESTVDAPNDRPADYPTESSNGNTKFL